MKYFTKNIILYISFFIVLIFLIFFKKRRKKIIFGVVPMIQYKYWSNTLKKNGFDSETLVEQYFKISKKKDFDIYTEELVPRFISFSEKSNKVILGPIFAFIYVVRNASIFNSSFEFGVFRNYPTLSKLEFLSYKFFKISTMITSFGGDIYMYSKVLDKSLNHGLLMSYPYYSIIEKKINDKVDFFLKNVDFFMSGFLIDGIGRWDCLMPSLFTLENHLINDKRKFSQNKKITIVHAPNHRGFKGSEFIIQAVNNLIADGYEIRFKLLEGIGNDEVLRILNEEADILVDQIIFPGYALNAIEGMASGIPVLSNLENKTYMELFRRYSYLNECPILSTSPETIEKNLKLLIENTKLREDLGKIGIQFVKKYHSEETYFYLYSKIFSKLINKKNEDLINLFHPLKSEFVKNNLIKTPLIENKYLDV